ncbi:hypothetical protein [Winogradskyella sp. Asnod2-B02-A]|uniref:hypothetical protein n=1 Tax=Winogradskyella sp. Asnod2-B02-A TaxID=3160583 RepID=UPI00386521D6
MKQSFLFINCDEAKHICDKAQYGEASSWERVKLTIRLAYCRVTQNYSSKNSKLTESIEKAEVKCLKAEERKKIENQFKEELAKQQHSH